MRPGGCLSTAESLSVQLQFSIPCLVSRATPRFLLASLSQSGLGLVSHVGIPQLILSLPSSGWKRPSPANPYQATFSIAFFSWAVPFTEIFAMYKDHSL